MVSWNSESLVLGLKRRGLLGARPKIGSEMGAIGDGGWGVGGFLHRAPAAVQVNTCPAHDDNSNVAPQLTSLPSTTFAKAVSR